METKRRTWKLSDETKKRMSLGWIKRKKRKDYQDFIEIVRAVGFKNKGNKMSLDVRKKMSEYQKNNSLRYWQGKKNPNVSREKHWAWKGGITPLKLVLRKSADYKRWRKAVYERDKYSCVMCGDSTGGNLNADHHPIPFWKLMQDKDYETMWNISNGRTLCKTCHLSETLRLEIHRSNQPKYASHTL